MVSPSPAEKNSKLRNFFLTEDGFRLRAGWRIIAHAIAYNLLLICVSIPIYIPIVLKRVNPDIFWLSELIQLVVVTSTVFIACRFLDRRSISSLGLKWNQWALIDILTGLLITFLMMGLIFFIEYSSGWLKFEGFTWQKQPTSSVTTAMFGMLILFILVGWNEELLFRGYRLQNLRDGLPSMWAYLVSAAWFGIVHLANPNANWTSAVGILLAGIFLALPVFMTGQLWLSIGLHIGWNLFEGPVFGFPVSGLTTYTLTKISVSGPDLFTGGAFGPESGLILLPAILIGTGLIFFYYRIRPKTPVPFTEN